MGGSAPDRDTLLKDADAMKASPFLASFDSPISNLFQKEKVSFQFQATLRNKAASAPKTAAEPPAP